MGIEVLGMMKDNEFLEAALGLLIMAGFIGFVIYAVVRGSKK
jgi:hypothetical protein